MMKLATPLPLSTTAILLTIINADIKNLGYKNNTVCHCNRDGYQCNVKSAHVAGSIGTGNPYQKYGIDIIQFVGSYSTDYFTFQPYSGECATVSSITTKK